MNTNKAFTPRRSILMSLLGFFLLVLSSAGCKDDVQTDIFKGPVDYVNPYMGNISHLLIPTFPTVHLPNSMLRMCPVRTDYTSQLMDGLPLLLTSHRGANAFRLSPLNHLPDSIPAVASYTYDNEAVRPYRYSVLLDEEDVEVDFAPSFRSAIYRLGFNADSSRHYLVIHSEKGELTAEGNVISGYRYLQDSTRVFVYMETEQQPVTYARRSEKGEYIWNKGKVTGKTLVLNYDPAGTDLFLRYGISYISVAQAKKNLRQEIQAYNVEVVSKMGRNEWNKTLGKVQIEGGTIPQRQVFYTSLYRTYERMINISEDGHFYSAEDHAVHPDRGIPFYTDDWVWDTYRAVHPLRILLEPEKESDMVNSYIRMALLSREKWLPTFPEVTGDSHRMNGNHAIAMLADAYAKGLTGFNLNEAYTVAKKVMAEKTYAPWRRMPKGALDQFFDEKGYYPALPQGQKETDPTIHSWEKRQAVAVTLAIAYDYWCLSRLAQFSGHEHEAREFLRRSYDYRHLYNSETGFFHPKDEKGRFIQPFDYEFDGGPGARDYYDENNAYTYRWDVQHNLHDLIALMDGPEQFVSFLDQIFRTPMSTWKFNFYSKLPDQTGNVGQFSMANEPSLHIPYLYVYAGQPWRTQKLIHELVNEWFRNDLMGVPGDEDGGGLSAFAVFSMMGFYPVTPGLPVYVIGSPFFSKITIDLGGGNHLTIIANGAGAENKYIQKAVLNGKTLDKAWFQHSDIAQGGILELKMGPRPNKLWGVDTPPPSADPYPGD
ncbi:MAG: GH92 family glycosyl hydrolase [Porphyromonas gingivalis]